MRMDKQTQKLSQPNNKPSHAAEAKVNHPIISNHQYLNFVKRNAKMMQNSQLERNKLIYPSAIEIARHNSVFLSKDQHYYKTEKLATSINTPYIGSKKEASPEQIISSKKIYEIIEKKNQEIQQSINKERQSMSDIVYNYSKFRSMEQNYYKNEKVDKIKKKHENKIKNKDIGSIKFPLIPKNNQEVFTIQYDGEGKKIVKVNLGQSPNKKKSQSLVNEKQKEKPTRLSQSDMQSLKHEVNFFKRRKFENQFGIQIKSINSRIIENLNQYQNGLKIRKQLYEIIPTDPARKSRLSDLKKENDEFIEQRVYLQENITQQSTNLKKEYYSTDSFHFNIVSTDQAASSSMALKNRKKFTALNVERCQKAEAIDQQLQIDLPPQQECEIIYFKQKDKPSEANLRRQKKSVSLMVNDKQITIYDQKINSYREFLFMLNFAHLKFDQLALKQVGSLKSEEKYRYYIGGGNNSLLVKSIFQRRFWWNQEDDYKKANLAWTQLKIVSFFELQTKSNNKNIENKLEQNIKIDNSKKKKIAKNVSQIKPKAGFKPPFPAQKEKIFTNVDKYYYEAYQYSITTNQQAQKMARYSNRLKYFQPNYLEPLKEDKSQLKMHNHLQFNHFIGNKKALFYNIKRYYQLKKKNPFEIIPLTFHIKDGTNDPQYVKFTKQFKKIQNQKYSKKKAEDDQLKKKLKNVWIVKPGQLSNRGNGIVVIDEIYELNNILKKKQKHNDGNDKTYIVQKYIENPLLYKGRKFDIRHYMLITRLHGIMRAYWYGQGYIRTSSYDFDLDDIGDQMIHLTNDAIQKNCTFYGKHEEGNKLSYTEFQKYLDQKFGEGKCSFSDHIYPKMKSIATDAVKSTYLQLDTNKLEHNFQVFGLDFMIDENFNVWLIEVNTNPCLELSSKLLGRIIPNMLEHAFRLSIDVIFPPPCHYPNSQKYLAPDNPLGRLNYELIFDEARDSKELIQLYKNTKEIDYGGEINEDNDVYQNEGKQLQLSPDLN